MAIRRRDFLNGMAGAGLLSLGSSPPELLLRAARAAERTTHDEDRILVFIQLSGGNDGLNTVVPVEDDAYFKARPGIQLGRRQLHSLSDGLAMHPGMEEMARLFADGHLNIVQGVGYPRPDRSHFRSMDIWHSARMDASVSDTGWLGRSVEHLPVMPGASAALALGVRQLPLALVSRRINVPAIHEPGEYRWSLLDRDDPKADRIISSVDRIVDRTENPLNDELAFLSRSARASYQSARRLREVIRDDSAAVDYPATGLGSRLRYVAQMIAGDLGTRIFFLSLDGFDTHSRQVEAHAALLSEMSDGIGAFMRDLRGRGLSQRVAVVTYSEFGRRVRENGSLGTDHGAASQMFVVAEGHGGVTGEHPSLTDLDDGDLRFHTDFRRVYATLLDRWMKLPASEVLGAEYQMLPLMHSA